MHYQLVTVLRWNASPACHCAQVECITSLSVLELYVLIAMHRLEGRQQRLCNFEMVADEYKTLQQQAPGDQWHRRALIRAFQRLLATGDSHVEYFTSTVF
jgi:Origin recognition complex (ORC) subunit 4 C-terminus